MSYSVKKIIVGAASLYVSRNDSTDSTFWGTSGSPSYYDYTTNHVPTLTANVPSSGLLMNHASWRHLGYTTDGVEFSYEPDFGEVVVDQLLDAAKVFKQGMKASVKTTLAEATLENLVLAWGQDHDSATGLDLNVPDTSGQEPLVETSTSEQLGISSGDLYDEPVERALIFVGPAPRKPGATPKRERVYFLRRALNVESSAHKLAKTDATTIPVSLRVLPDPYYSGKEYGVIRDRNVST
jgi:hypothetical protein